jgi:hypothetical protein
VLKLSDPHGLVELKKQIYFSWQLYINSANQNIDIFHKLLSTLVLFTKNETVAQFTWVGIIESLNERDYSAFTRATAANQSYGLSSWDIKRKIVQNSSIWPW